jgi:hypothetical protein
VDAIVLRAMRKHPDNRYPSMNALIADVVRTLQTGSNAMLRHGLCAEQEAELSVLPDRYSPTTEHGQAALKLLARKFGKFAAASCTDEA